MISKNLSEASTQTISDSEKKWQIDWSTVSKVTTKRGIRDVRSGTPTNEFWSDWRANKNALKAAGYTLNKDDKDGSWTVKHWGRVAKDKVLTSDSLDVDRMTAAQKAVNLSIPSTQTLFPYQHVGAAYIVVNNSVLITDEPGLGKTIQTIAARNTLKPRGRTLIVCPLVVIGVWVEEMKKWDTTGSSVQILGASNEISGDVVLSTYARILMRSDDLKAQKWSIAVFDESHNLKNAQAKRTQVAFALEAERKILLTGTPLLTRPKDLWAQLHICDPEQFKNFFSFGRKFCDGHQGRFGWDFTGASNLSGLNELLRQTVMLGRKKEDVLKELPPKRWQTISLSPISKLEQALSKEESECSDVDVGGAGSLPAIKFKQISQIRHRGALAKVPHAVEHLLNMVGGKPVVVFTHHKDVAEGIKSGLLKKEPGLRIAKLTGDTPVEKRNLMVEQFQAKEYDLMIATIGAAGVGITLTAASTAVFVELDWTPALMRQAEDRLHRIGAQDSVHVQYLVFEESMDARLAKVLSEKQTIISKGVEEAPDQEVIDIEWVEGKPSEEQTEPVLPAAELAILHRAAYLMRMSDLDNATEPNDIGYNQRDTKFGKVLASREVWSPRMQQAAKHMLRKYHGQDVWNGEYEVVYGRSVDEKDKAKPKPKSASLAR